MGHLSLAGSLAVAALISVAAAAPQQVAAPVREPDVIFVPTRQAVADGMMKLASVGKNDVVYDLGCGDGMLLMAAARAGARAVGIDIDPRRIAEATANVKAAGLENRITLILGDFFDPKVKIGEATVVTLYLLERLNIQLIPRLKTELKPGSRVVSHAWTMGSQWAPDKIGNVEGTPIYLWTIPKP
ncbi:MAG TPA: methyltransferase domain-containing protein [Vicinamibacterales bacterium]|nr:methyltransferase domain-containing protein [Vicinamibacterales bacterium]